MSDYDDIINLPHHTSKTRQKMSMHDRAAQFSSFKALTGFEQTIFEVTKESQKPVKNEKFEELP